MAQLLERYRKGEQAFQLGPAFGLHPKTVGEIVKRAGIRRPRSMTDDERVVAARLYAEGWSCARIGSKLGRDHGTVWLALKTAGVQLRQASERK